MRSLKDKVVVITGASRGIGEGIARQFAPEGARLLLAGRDQGRLDSLADSIGGDSSRVTTISCDITQPGGMDQIVATACEHFGVIDLFVNNAGVGIHRPVSELSEEDFDTIFATNLKAVFFSFKALLPLMRAQGFGQIINISSMAGKQGAPGMSAYAASKAALNVFSEAIAGEVRNDNIKISVLAPASTDTNFMSNLSGESKTPSRASKKLTVDEVAEAVIFLAKQNENAWMSLAEIRPLFIKR